MQVKPSEVGASTPRTLGRIVLAATLALFVGVVVLPLGLSVAQTTATRIEFVNPAASTSTTVSDKSGLPYGITAWIDAVPQNPRVEFSVKNSGGTVVVPPFVATQLATPDAFGAEWDVPDSLADGSYTLVATLFKDYTGPGTGTVVDTDEQAITVDAKAETSPLGDTPAAENAQITYPVNGGPLSVSIPSTGGGAFLLEGETSEGTSTVTPYYSVTPAGGEVTFKSCGSATTVSDTDANGKKDFRVRCTTASGDFPLDVTAVAIVPTRAGALPVQTFKGASDGHRVDPYFARPTTLDLQPESYSNVPANTCQKFTATVKDQNGRIMPNANVDAHASGPDEALKFDVTTTFGSHASQAPDKGDHTKEPGFSCNAQGNGGSAGAADTQGNHPVADAPDRKHIESRNNTDNNGQFIFAVYSTTTGGTQITAWADLDDDDLLCNTEARDSSSVGWGVIAPAPSPEAGTVPTCTVAEPSPTPSPTASASGSPSASPSGSPSGSPSASPSGSPSASPSTSPTTEPEPRKNARNISLNLRHGTRGASLIAKGRVTLDGAGFAGCTKKVPVKVQRKVRGGWATVKQVDTRNTGKYKVVFNDRKGRYRAVAVRVEKAQGMEVCGKAVARKRHRH